MHIACQLKYTPVRAGAAAAPMHKRSMRGSKRRPQKGSRGTPCARCDARHAAQHATDNEQFKDGQPWGGLRARTLHCHHRSLAGWGGKQHWRLRELQETALLYVFGPIRYLAFHLW